VHVCQPRDSAGICGIGKDFGADRRIDAGGLLVLPGIVDLHGDAFERQMMPRPGVEFPIDVALIDTDRQVVGREVRGRHPRIALRSIRTAALIAGSRAAGARAEMTNGWLQNTLVI
jgi:alpha-D-ribose 1-methylphosphonate 5-triphosphate diphosphatase PhnM